MSRSHLERLGGSVKTRIPRDADGYIDRECPRDECRKEFKLMPGTGLLTPAPCICPYCGHSAESSEFTARGQRNYAIEDAKAQFREAYQKDLRNAFGGLSSRPSSGGMVSVSFELKTTPPRKPTYLHKQLETKIVCPHCDLHYAIYGKFAFCPDCGKHNSTQMLEANFGLVERTVTLAESFEDADMKRHWIENSLADSVSAFDGFGRELVRVKAAAVGHPAKADGVTFQNLAAAEKRLTKDFALALSGLFDDGAFDFATRMFLRRHVIAHCFGVIDAEYVRKSGDPTAVVGRRLSVDPQDVLRLVAVLRVVAQRLEQAL